MPNRQVVIPAQKDDIRPVSSVLSKQGALENEQHCVLGILHMYCAVQGPGLTPPCQIGAAIPRLWVKKTEMLIILNMM